jgi:hypothetical protein
MDLRYALPLAALVTLASPRLAAAHEARTPEQLRDSSVEATAATTPTIRLLTRVDVDTSIRQPITRGCEVQSIVRGSYQTSNLDGHPTPPLRDVDVTGTSVVVCDGNEVRAVKQRFALPIVQSRDELAALLGQDLTARPYGSECAWAPTFGFERGQMEATGIASTCSRPDATASLSPYRAWERTVEYPAAATMSRGGGPTAK